MSDKIQGERLTTFMNNIKSIGPNKLKNLSQKERKVMNLVVHGKGLSKKEMATFEKLESTRITEVKIEGRQPKESTTFGKMVKKVQQSLPGSLGRISSKDLRATIVKGPKEGKPTAEQLLKEDNPIDIELFKLKSNNKPIQQEMGTISLNEEFPPLKEELEEFEETELKVMGTINKKEEELQSKLKEIDKQEARLDKKSKRIEKKRKGI